MASVEDEMVVNVTALEEIKEAQEEREVQQNKPLYDKGCVDLLFVELFKEGDVDSLVEEADNEEEGHTYVKAIVESISGLLNLGFVLL